MWASACRKSRLHEYNVLFDNFQARAAQPWKADSRAASGPAHAAYLQGPIGARPLQEAPRNRSCTSGCLQHGTDLQRDRLPSRLSLREVSHRVCEAAAHGKVLLDETPIGNFLEIEGSPRWIDRTARALGFFDGDYITRSYGYLYLAYCRERRMRPARHGFRPKEMKRSARTHTPERAHARDPLPCTLRRDRSDGRGLLRELSGLDGTGPGRILPRGRHPLQATWK